MFGAEIHHSRAWGHKLLLCGGGGGELAGGKTLINDIRCCSCSFGEGQFCDLNP